MANLDKDGPDMIVEDTPSFRVEEKKPEPPPAKEAPKKVEPAKEAPKAPAQA